MEESTTLEKEPPQDKTSNLGSFLDSHSLPRDDMSVGGFGCPHGLSLGRFRNGTQAVPYVFAGGFYLCALCCYNNKRRSAPHPGRHPLPLPLGVVSERSEDGEGQR